MRTGKPAFNTVKHHIMAFCADPAAPCSPVAAPALQPPRCAALCQAPCMFRGQVRKSRAQLGSPDRFKLHHACSPQCLARAKKCACGRGGCVFDWCSLNATTARAMVWGEPCCTRAMQTFNCHFQANCHVWGCLPCWPPVGGGPWTCLQGLAAAEFSKQNTMPCTDGPRSIQSKANCMLFKLDLNCLVVVEQDGRPDRGVPRFCCENKQSNANCIRNLFFPKAVRKRFQKLEPFCYPSLPVPTCIPLPQSFPQLRR
jgi:hypothetical protein